MFFLQEDFQNGSCLNTPHEILRSADLQLELAGTQQPMESRYTAPTQRDPSPVGSGKTALTLALFRLLRTQYNIGMLSPAFPQRAYGQTPL